MIALQRIVFLFSKFAIVILNELVKVGDQKSKVEKFSAEKPSYLSSTYLAMQQRKRTENFELQF